MNILENYGSGDNQAFFHFLMLEAYVKKYNHENKESTISLLTAIKVPREEEPEPPAAAVATSFFFPNHNLASSGV